MHGIRLSQEYQQDPYFGYPFQIGEAECVTGRDFVNFQQVQPDPASLDRRECMCSVAAMLLPQRFRSHFVFHYFCSLVCRFKG